MNLFELSAVIGLKDDGFTSGIKNALNPVKNLTSGVSNMGNKLSSFIGVAAGLKIVQLGFSALSSSIGGAVDRFDTLQQFPKMMEQLGYSTDDATAATKKLSDGIDGLPTSLDEVAATAQNLTLLTGNLEKSTDMTIALNNAFLASGASSADASRGLTQYTQMLSKGKVDQQSWNTLLDTMPYALTKVAESFGYAGKSAKTDLYAALKSGTITFDQFNEKVLELNEGTEGFAKVAKTASVGIKTSFTNVKTAVVKNLAIMIEIIDTSMKKLEFPGVAESLNSLKDVVNTVMGNINSSIETLIERAGSSLIAFRKAFQSGDWEAVGSSVTAIIGSFINTINSGLPNIVQSAVDMINSFLSGLSNRLPDILQSGVEMYTTFIDGIRQMLPNISTIVGDIIAAFIQYFYTKASLTFEAGIQIITGIITGIANNIDNIVPVIVDLIKNVIKTIKDNIPLIINAAKEIIVGLAEGLGEAFPIIRPFTNIIKTLAENLETVIPIALTAVAAFEGFKILVGITTTITTLSGALTTLSGLFGGATIAGNGVAAAAAGVTTSLSSILLPIGLVVGAVVGLIAWWKDLGDRNSELKDRLLNHWNNIKESLSGAIDRIKEALGGFTDSAKNLWESIQPVIDFLVEAFTIVLAPAIEKAVDIIGDAIAVAIDIVSGIIDALSGFIDIVVGIFTGDMEKVKEGFSSIWEGIKEIFSSVIDFILVTVGGLPENIWDAIVGVVDKVIEWGASLLSTIITEMPLIISATIDFFKELPGKIWDAIIGAVDKVIQWGARMVSTARSNASSFITNTITLLTSLPGKIWDAIVGAIGKVVQWGKDMVAKGKEAALNVVDGIFDKLNELPGKVVEIGTNLVKGLWKGINDVKDWIIEKIGGWAGSIVQSIKDFFKESSPSKITTEIGEFLGIGLGNGIINSLSAVLRDVGKFSSSIINAFQNEGIIQGIVDEFESATKEAELLFNPTSKLAFAGTDNILGDNLLSNSTGKTYGDTYITQNIQAVPQSEYELAVETRNAFRRLRWS